MRKGQERRGGWGFRAKRGVGRASGKQKKGAEEGGARPAGGANSSVSPRLPAWSFRRLIQHRTPAREFYRDEVR